MMKIENKVVARFRDGKMVKGYTHDFHPNRETFHVTEVLDTGSMVEVPISLLKAIFFVKTFEGNKDHQTAHENALEILISISGLKMKVAFSDGEVMYGTTHGYTPERKGFFIFPTDKESNNERVFVIRESTDVVETWR
jgi:hypothetical protein